MDSILLNHARLWAPLHEEAELVRSASESAHALDHPCEDLRVREPHRERIASCRGTQESPIWKALNRHCGCALPPASQDSSILYMAGCGWTYGWIPAINES